MNYTEKIYYIVDTSTGKDMYCGKSANYPMICATGKTLDELKNSVKEQLTLTKECLEETIEKPDSLEMVEEKDQNSWLFPDINTSYWEMKRLKHLLNTKGDVRDVLLNIITNTVKELDIVDENCSMYIAAKVIKAIIEYKN